MISPTSPPPSPERIWRYAFDTDSRLARAGGAVMGWSGDSLAVTVGPQRDRHELNQTAALVFLACDSRSPVSEVIETLSGLFPDQGAEVRRDVWGTLQTLLDLGLLVPAGERATKPLVRLAFCGFPPAPDPAQDYFLEMVRPYADIMHVAVEAEPDLLFEVCPPIADSAVQYIARTSSAARADGEYAFTFGRDVPPGFAGRHQRIAPWALSVAWSGGDAPAGAVPRGRLGMPRLDAMDRAKDRFCALLGPAEDPRLARLRSLLQIDEADAGASRDFVELPDWPPSAEQITQLEHCRFALVAEPVEQDGYCSARLLHALAAGAVPVYFGDPGAGADFNPRAFMNARDFPSLEAIAERVHAVSQDLAAYQGYLRAPVFKDLAQMLTYAPAATGTRFAAAWLGPPAPQAAPPAGESSSAKIPRLSVGMATYDDFDGVYFTVQALRLYHPEVAEDLEILVLDNNPGGPASTALQTLGKGIPGYRYIPTREFQGTAVRDLVFREARAEQVLCLDSHVLIAPGALARLIAYFEAHPDCPNLLQGPLLADDLASISTHFEPEWRAGMYGVWALDDRGLDPGAAPFEIPMQGLGVFACRKAAWPGFNPRFRGFGGEEGYIHEKFRQAGHATLCLPFLRWAHRFHRPAGTRYRNDMDDRIRNYLLGSTELGLDTGPVQAHFRSLCGAAAVERALFDMQRERSNPFSFFDAIYCINRDADTDRWVAMLHRFEQLGIRERVHRYSAVETEDSHPVGCTLSHRRVVERAALRGLDNILVLEDDAVFAYDTPTLLGASLAELRGLDWSLFYLGGATWGNDYPAPAGCSQLGRIDGSYLTCTHAVAYHRSCFQRILADIPDSIADVREWIGTHLAIDQYLNQIPGRYVTKPLLAAQPFLLEGELQALKYRFAP